MKAPPLRGLPYRGLPYRGLQHGGLPYRGLEHGPRASLPFAPDEVHCFLRPQAVLCDRWLPGAGPVLLLLDALERFWGGAEPRPALPGLEDHSRWFAREITPRTAIALRPEPAAGGARAALRELFERLPPGPGAGDPPPPLAEAWLVPVHLGGLDAPGDGEALVAGDDTAATGDTAAAGDRALRAAVADLEERRIHHGLLVVARAGDGTSPDDGVWVYDNLAPAGAAPADGGPGEGDAEEGDAEDGQLPGTRYGFRRLSRGLLETLLDGFRRVHGQPPEETAPSPSPSPWTLGGRPWRARLVPPVPGATGESSPASLLAGALATTRSALAEGTAAAVDGRHLARLEGLVGEVPPGDPRLEGRVEAYLAEARLLRVQLRVLRFALGGEGPEDGGPWARIEALAERTEGARTVFLARLLAGALPAGAGRREAFEAQGRELAAGTEALGRELLGLLGLQDLLAAVPPEHRPTAEPAPPAGASDRPTDPPSLSDSPPGSSSEKGGPAAIAEGLRSLAARVLGRGEGIDLDRGFAEQGGSSLALVHLLAGILDRFGVGLTLDEVLAASSLRDLAGTIAARGQAGAGASDGLPEARQGVLTGPVPVLANRHSYFLRKRRHLEGWSLASDLLELTEPLDRPALEGAVEALVAHHDGLRLEGGWGEPASPGEPAIWQERLAPPVSGRYLVRRVAEAGLGDRPPDHGPVLAWARRVVAEELARFAFPGPLFRVVLLEERPAAAGEDDGSGPPGRAWLVLLGHHLLLDAFSFHRVTEDLFHLYRALRRRGPEGRRPVEEGAEEPSAEDAVAEDPAAAARAVLPPKPLALPDLAALVRDHWDTPERRSRELAYWEGLPWDRAVSLLHPAAGPVAAPGAGSAGSGGSGSPGAIVPAAIAPAAIAPAAGANRERHTRYAVRTRPVADPPAFVAALRDPDGPGFVDRVLAAIARAHHRWTGVDTLPLALVVLGRESFVPGLDLSRTVGWISETVPLVLTAVSSSDDEAAGEDHLLGAIHAQRLRAETRGKAFGVLRHLSRDPAVVRRLAALPEPEVSLNILPPSLEAAERSGTLASELRVRGTLPVPPPGDTERVFLLSGGVFFRGGALHISWDFSPRVLDPAAVETFTELCLEELEALIPVVAAGGSAP